MIVLSLQAADWLGLLLYFLSLSLLAVGGAISLAPEMHRFLVDEQGWLTELQFNASIAIAQAAPGPNLLFVALLGWNVGLNAAGSSTGSAAWALGLLGAGLTMLGILLPSATLTWLATRWAQRNRHRRSVRAFKQGMAPLVIGFIMATAWVLGRGQGQIDTDAGLWLLGLVCALLVWRTQLHLLWLLALGAVLGVLGWV